MDLIIIFEDGNMNMNKAFMKMRMYSKIARIRKIFDIYFELAIYKKIVLHLSDYEKEINL